MFQSPAMALVLLPLGRASNSRAGACHAIVPAGCGDRGWIDDNLTACWTVCSYANVNPSRPGTSATGWRMASEWRRRLRGAANAGRLRGRQRQRRRREDGITQWQLQGRQTGGPSGGEGAPLLERSRGSVQFTCPPARPCPAAAPSPTSRRIPQRRSAAF